MFFVYGRVAHSVLGWDIPYHTFTSFSLFVSLFVAFVLSLKAGLYRVQFAMFAWVFIALIIIILQSVLLVYNMFNGLFWFVLPAILVMSNDSWAYVWGQLIGKHSLLELSPRKTWEGFIGAFISTCLTAFFVSGVMVQFPILTCPQDVLQIAHPVCDVAPVFLPAVYALPGPGPVLGWTSVSIAPVQIHALFMGIFASIVAPFGGFFASGFKRAFKIKDFGDLIPGHGGLTDRINCQLLMGVFVYVYYSTFVNPSETTACICAIAADKVNVNSLFDAAKGLSTVDRARLAQMLVGK
jgi:phosphatidate cytidylyltransferase